MGLSPIIWKSCSCCKKSRRDDYYKNNSEICIPCSIFCNGKEICQISGEVLVELFHNFKKYFVKKSEVDNKHNKVIVLPDGTTFDLTQMYVDDTDRHCNKLDAPRFRGSNSDYEIWGQLPTMGAVRATAVG